MPAQPSSGVQLKFQQKLPSPQGNFSQCGEKQQAGDNSVEEKTIENSSKLKGPGTSNVVLNFEVRSPTQAKSTQVEITAQWPENRD